MAKSKPIVKGKKKTQLYKLAPHINEGKIVTDLRKKSWRIGKSIGSGGFGEIYTASDDISKPVESDAPYVAKIEPKANGPLFAERAFYLAGAKEETIENWKKSHGMKFLGMPPYVASGTCEQCGEELRFLIMYRYGTDIGKLFEQNKRKMPFQTVMNLGIKIVNILEYIHCQGYIHGDVKGSNLLRGIKKGEEDEVYLVDYGLATKYIKDGVMRRTEKDSRFAHNGTLEFASRDAHLGISSRRSDLEILGYNLLQWLSGNLPWEEKTLTEDGKQPLSEEEVAAAKDNHMKNLSKLVARIPKEVASEPIEKYLGYVNSLKIEQEPDYDKCRSIFTEGLKKAGLPNNGKLIFYGTQQIKSKITAEAENQYGKKKRPVRGKGSRKPCIPKNTNKSPAGTDSSLVSDTEDEVILVKKPKESKKFLGSSVGLNDCATDTRVSGSLTTPNLAGPSGYPTPAMIALKFALRRKKVEVKEKKKKKPSPSSSETSSADSSEVLTPAMLEVIEIRNRKAKTAKKECKSDSLSKFDKSEALDTLTKNRSKGPPRRPPSQSKRNVLGSKISPVFKSNKSPLSRASRTAVTATQTSPGIFATPRLPMTRKRQMISSNTTTEYSPDIF